MNNVQKFSIDQTGFQSDFGFTRDEVIGLMNKPDVHSTSTIEDISKWYNQVSVGDEKIVNIKSVKECFKNNGKLAIYNDLKSGRQ